MKFNRWDVSGTLQNIKLNGDSVDKYKPAKYLYWLTYEGMRVHCLSVEHGKSILTGFAKEMNEAQ